MYLPLHLPTSEGIRVHLHVVIRVRAVLNQGKDADESDEFFSSTFAPETAGELDGDLQAPLRGAIETKCDCRKIARPIA